MPQEEASFPAFVEEVVRFLAKEDGLNASPQRKKLINKMLDSKRAHIFPLFSRLCPLGGAVRVSKSYYLIPTLPPGL